MINLQSNIPYPGIPRLSAEATSRSLGTAHAGLPFWDNGTYSSYLILFIQYTCMEYLYSRLEINHVSDFSDNLNAIQTALATAFLNDGQNCFFLIFFETPSSMPPQESKNEISQTRA